MEPIDEKHYRLTSGRIVEVAAGVVGLPDLAIDGWTAEERSELADFMIDQWRRFKQDDDRVVGGLVVISDTDDGGMAVLARDGSWLPADTPTDHRRRHCRTFESIGEAWTFLHERPDDWWHTAPGARPRVAQAW
jgi:hypothetical protein